MGGIYASGLKGPQVILATHRVVAPHLNLLVAGRRKATDKELAHTPIGGRGWGGTVPLGGMKQWIQSSHTPRPWGGGVQKTVIPRLPPPPAVLLITNQHLRDCDNKQVVDLYHLGTSQFVCIWTHPQGSKIKILCHLISSSPPSPTLSSSWIKARAGYQGNKLANAIAKWAAFFLAPPMGFSALNVRIQHV